MTLIQIVNVVATATMNQQIDFGKLRKFKEIKHDPDVYGGRVAYFKSSAMEGKVSIFTPGKMISVGTKSEKQAIKELNVAMRFLVKKALARKVELQPRIENLVVTADFGKGLNLEKFSENLRAIYEPEQFAGAILRLEQPFKASILVFSSGKTVITGLKSAKQIDPTTQCLKNLISSYG